MANSPYSPPWENPSFQRPETQSFRISEHHLISSSRVSCLLHVVDVVLSQIKDRWEKFQSVSTSKELKKIRKKVFKLFSFTVVSSSAPLPLQNSHEKKLWTQKKLWVTLLLFLRLFCGFKISLNPQNSQKKKVCTHEIIKKARWHRPTRPTKFSTLYKEPLAKEISIWKS